MNDWTLSVAYKTGSVSLLLTYSGAFDCVSHEKLFTRLYTYGIQGDHSPVFRGLDGSVLNWFK